MVGATKKREIRDENSEGEELSNNPVKSNPLPESSLGMVPTRLFDPAMKDLRGAARCVAEGGEQREEGYSMWRFVDAASTNRRGCVTVVRGGTLLR